MLQLPKEDIPFLAQHIEDWGAFPALPCTDTVEYYGATQVLAGSDHPYFQEEKYVRAFDYIRSSTLSESDRQRILSGNATELYSSPIRHCEERSSVFHREA